MNGELAAASKLIFLCSCLIGNRFWVMGKRQNPLPIIYVIYVEKLCKELLWQSL